MERDLINPEVVYDYIGGASPSEAGGNYRGKKFYFYARWDDWSFVLSENSAVEPDNILLLIDYDLEIVQKSEQPFPSEWIEAFRNTSFIRCGTYGEPKSWTASYMPKEDIMKIIRDCISEYERTG